MPPFRAGLLKRKAQPEGGKEAEAAKESSSSEEEQDLLRELGDDGDATDSEHEEQPGGADSDHEVEEVLYDDDADSTLGDEDEEGASDDSSEVEDSEDDDDDEDEEDEDEGDSDENDKPASEDSGAESGLGQTHSGTSDEDTKPKEATKKVKRKRKPAPTTKSSVDVLADKIKETSVTSQPIEQKDEYGSGDSSDEEGRVNTAGEVPRWWYDEYPHVGYDLDARRILRPPQRDRIDDFLKKCEDPEFWRTVRDPSTGQDVVLSAEDLQLIARLRQGQLPDPNHDDYQPWVEWFTREVLATPVRAFPEHKRSFLPSRDEQRQVARLVHALKMGWAKTRKQIADERRKKKERRFYDLWGSAPAEGSAHSGARVVAAPRRALPSHAESYNPPPEYLLDKKEMKEWESLNETPWKRKYTFLPTRYGSLRAVPAYPRLTRERFLRCLDLYLAPRAIKMRLTIGPDDLVPKLPSPRDLQPFPTSEALAFRGHTALVRAVDFDPSGQYAVSGSDDGTLKVWETSSGRCLRTIILDEPVSHVAWTPAVGLSLVAAAAGNRLVLLNPGAGIGAHRVASATDDLLAEPPPAHDVVMDARTASCVQWESVTPEEWAKGERIRVTHFRPISHVSWHARGDYLAVSLSGAAARSVVVHQVSRRRSQLPFAKPKGLVQAAVFHPLRPLLFVATQRVVRVYDLVKQQLTRKLLTGAQWVSGLAVHPRGDNLLVCSYDRKCIWFDLELSSSPYRTLRLHGGAVRAVAFHRRYPLWASAGDDGGPVVSHGMVYNDLLQNPLLVPLRRLRGPEKRGELCVTGLSWHPEQPWLLAAGADHTLRLYA